MAALIRCSALGDCQVSQLETPTSDLMKPEREHSSFTAHVCLSWSAASSLRSLLDMNCAVWFHSCSFCTEIELKI